MLNVLTSRMYSVPNHRTGVVVFDGTVPEKTGPQFEGPGKGFSHQIIEYFFACVSLIRLSLKCIFKISISQNN